MSSSSTGPGITAQPDNCEGNCTVEKFMTEGTCKKEFVAFDTCYDAAQAKGESEDVCLHLFDKFRECLQLRAKVDGIVKGAMG